MKFKAINQDDIDEKDKIKLFNQSRLLAAEMAFASKDLNIIRNTKSESSSRNNSRLQSKYGDITYSFSDGAQHVSTCTCEKCRKKSNNYRSKLKHKRMNLNGNGLSTTKEIYVASSSDKRVIIKNNTIVNGTFKMVGNVKLVIDILECHNFIRTTKSDFSILWTNHYIKGFKSLSRCQKINLFPRSYECTRKDSMARNINAMADLHGRKHFSYMPECFVLPQEREALLQAMESSRGRPWIIKPAGSSQGRGIYITSNPIELPDTYQNNKNDDNWIVERYIDNPLLVDSRKFDLRLYVVVTSYNPLKIYLHEEGLCRLATEKYTNETYYDKYAHLTNYSINKHNVKDRVPNPEDVDVENESKLKGNELKLSLAELNSILQDMNINTIPIWSKIEDLIVKTLISVESKIYNALDIYSVNNEYGTSSCFELFGFDVLIDANLNPFLLEVNFSPSLNTDSPLDLQVKSKVLADLFNLVGIRQSANSINPSKNDSSFALTDNTIDGIISELKLFDIDLQGHKGLKALNIFIKEMERANEGGYKLIFPITSQGQGEHISSMLKYNNFFEKERSLNKLLAQYIFATSLQQNKSKKYPEKEMKKCSLTANRLKEHLSNSKDFNSLWARASGRSVR